VDYYTYGFVVRDPAFAEITILFRKRFPIFRPENNIN